MSAQHGPIPAAWQEEFRFLIHTHVRDLRISGATATGKVPWRDDTHPSFTADLEQGVWYDQARKEGGGLKELKARLGMDNEEKRQRTMVATYDYRDEQGGLLFQVVRFAPKDFRQRRPDGNGGWCWNLNGTRRVLYRLPELRSAPTVYLVEGEKDADRLWSLGVPATTNPGGAGKWEAAYNESLRDKHLVMLPDYDPAGAQHEETVTRSVLFVAASLKVLHLPGLAAKGDVSDWLDAGHSKEELLALVQAAPFLAPADLPAGASAHAPDTPWARAKTAPDFLAEEDKEFCGLAKDLVAPGAITIIDAPKGVGKTHVVHALAVALATGGVFRGERVTPARVLLLDRENPVPIVKTRLRAWGAAAAADLGVLTRQDAPSLKDRGAWETFPVQDYDVVILDSVGASTEGITEREGKQTSEVLATLLDLAHRGMAIVLLQNTEKTGANIRGRGEWADRVDIQYEVRDATGFVPSGKRPWWTELPADGAANWAERAARRNKAQTKFRLAFIPAKYRLGTEPDPFCLELHLPKDEPWTLHEVTEELIQAGEEASRTAAHLKTTQSATATEALARLVTQRADRHDPLHKTEAETFLRKEQQLSQQAARAVITDGDGQRWDIRPLPAGRGRGTPQGLFPRAVCSTVEPE